MDGGKTQLTKSLRFRLSAGLAIAILGVALVAGIFSYWWAFEEAIELQDEQLIQLSALVNRNRIVQPDAETPIQISTVDPESHFVVQWLGANARETTIELPGLPDDIAEGLQTREVNGASWRLLVKKFDNGNRVVVAQQTEVRDEIAQASALNTLVPLIILIPLLLLWVAYLIGTVFTPLQLMAVQLDTTTDGQLMHLSEENLASEIAPFVMAINRLLKRLQESMAQQRQFVRDAAHELRSPITAISLQAERLVEQGLEGSIRQKMVNLHQATERTRNLIEQLLTLARAQEKQQTATSPISLKTLLRNVLEDLLPLADVKNIEISVLGEDSIVNSQAIDLQILVRNLLDNAIRYTPTSGQVEVMLNENDDWISLDIRDSGPGIAEQEQDRVFDPFYRVLGNNQTGSGLGLSIVRRIAERLEVGVELYNYQQGSRSGLAVRVKFFRH